MSQRAICWFSHQRSNISCLRRIFVWQTQKGDAQMKPAVPEDPPVTQLCSSRPVAGAEVGCSVGAPNICAF